MSKLNRPPSRRRGKGSQPRHRTYRIKSWVYGFVAAVLVVGAGLSVVGLLVGQGDSSQFPPFVMAASPEVREAYAYAMERPDVLQYIPCYCGCGQHSGHRSNLDCFIKGRNPDGTLVFEQHGAG